MQSFLCMLVSIVTTYTQITVVAAARKQTYESMRNFRYGDVICKEMFTLQFWEEAPVSALVCV